MTLLGAVGAGKTCAALALCDHVYRSMYESFAGHCDLLRMAQEGKLEWYSNGQGGKTTAPQVWKGYRDAPLVVLDEIGSREKVSDFQYSCLYDMLENRECKPLILISNLSLEELARVFDERIVSRIIAGTPIFVEGADMRDPRSKG
jgi:DNA replication protein DnaC